MRGDLEKEMARLANAGKWKLWLSTFWDAIFASVCVGALIGASIAFIRAGVFGQVPGFLMGLGVGLWIALALSLFLEER